MQKNATLSQLMTCLFISCASIAYSQNYTIDTLDWTNKQLCSTTPLYQLAASGIVYHNQILYVVSERCKKLLVLDSKTGKCQSEMPIQGIPDSAQLEAISYLDGYFYITDEYHACIYQIKANDTKPTAQRYDIKDFKIPIIDSRDGTKGLEGLAIDTAKKIFYLLQESREDSSKRYACIFALKIDTQHKQFVPAFQNTVKSTFKIRLDSGFRLTDICFQTDNQGNAHLYALKTKYDSNTKIGEYHLGALKINNQGKVKNDPWQPIKDITTPADNKNLEGITISPKGHIFIVNDNVWGEEECGQEVREENGKKDKTILLKLKKK